MDLSVLVEPPVVDSLAPMDAALNLGTTLLNPIPTQEDHLLGVDLRCHVRALRVHGGDLDRLDLGLVPLVLSHQAHLPAPF